MKHNVSRTRQTPPTAPLASDTRDMAGDALTTHQALSHDPPVDAECSLAAARNILRDESITRTYVRQNQRGGTNPDDPLCMRFPNWEAILETVRRDTEVVVQFRLEHITNRNILTLARLFVIARENPNHVIAAHVAGATHFRVYDNDSQERVQGTYALRTASQMPSSGTCTAVTRIGSPLARPIVPNTDTRDEADLASVILSSGS